MASGPGAASGLARLFDLKDETTTGRPDGGAWFKPAWPPRVRSLGEPVLMHINRALNKDLESMGDLLAFVCFGNDV
jgi:hypothetical protein